MFSCLLLRSLKDKKGEESPRVPLVADKTDISIQIVSQVGSGKARCSYTLDRDEKGLVLHVPSLLALRGATRQRLRVTSCRIQTTNTVTAGTTSPPKQLRLSKLNIKDYSVSKPIGTVPTHSSIREMYAGLLMQYSGAISSQDLLLYLGDLEACTLLEIHLEFLITFTVFPCHCAAASSPLTYALHTKMPTLQLNYSASLASPLPVRDVTPLAQTPCANFDDFRWDHIVSDNVVQIQFTSSPGQVDHHLCDPRRAHLSFLSSFSVQLAPGTPSGCCSLTFPTACSARDGACSSQSVVAADPGSTLGCDGVMMVNTTLTLEQLPPSVPKQPLHLSEFVFVIDCSGSMSGRNIQAATDTLITCVKSLPVGSYFNVIAFGSKFRQLFHTSAEYTKRSVERAVQFANQMQASLGGTELLTPLQWIFKKPLCEGLPRQIFIVTDGGVSNTRHVLHAVRKNSHLARCHTFGIGPDVCSELVTGIAVASGGRCVLLQDGERLQTKVMEVLRESLLPSISGSVLHWSPPEGYTLIDSTPKSIGTIYTGATHTVFGFLKRTDTSRSARIEVGSGSVRITGQAGNQEVKLDVKPVFLPQLTTTQTEELATIVDKISVWSKMCDIEMQLLSNSRKNSHSDKVQEPEAKRIKLNGFNHNSEKDKMVDPVLSAELVQLSLASGIPCGLTCFRDDNGQVLHILPNQQTTSDHSTSVHSNQKRTAQLQKMQNRNKRKQQLMNNHNHSAVLSTRPMSMASLTKSALTVVGSTLKTVAGTFGLVLPELAQGVENGQRIEDHLELEHRKKSSLYWDESKEMLIYPSSYYSSQSKQTTPTMSSTFFDGLSIAQNVAMSTESQSPHSVSTDSSSSDDEDFSISDTESNSSLDPDWDDLRRPAELRPLIQMQLFTGAWPMVRAFSYAVGVPLEEVRKLIVKHENVKSDNPPHINGVCQSAATEDEEVEEKCNVWTTALAIACLEEYFAPLKIEWEVVALKGQTWIEQNLDRESNLSAGEVSSIAKDLVSRWI